MRERKLKDIREYLKALSCEKETNELRVTRQVMDLQLLKVAVKERGLYEEDILGILDVCIDGFIWLYANGGTTTSLPSIVTEDTAAKEYYEKFCSAWDKVQDYMRYNMSLMDI